MTEIKTPLCPSCNAQPALLVGTQAFCDAADCATFCWIITEDADTLRANATVVDLSESYVPQPSDREPDSGY